MDLRQRGNLRHLPDSGKGIARSGVHVLLVFVVLLMILPAALHSVPVAFICAYVLVIATMALIVGLGRTGSGFLILGFATVPWTDVHPIGSLPFLELADVFFVTGFLLLIARFAGTTLRLPTEFLFGGVGFVAVGILSALASDQPGANFDYFLDVVVGVVLLSVLLVWWQPGRRTTIAAASAYLLGNAVNVVASLVEDPAGDGRDAGLTTHPNVMGVSLALSIALVPFLVGTLPRRYRWIVAIGYLVFMYGIWISGSRAALLCAVVLTLMYPLFKRSIPAALAVAALCLPAIVVVDRVSQNPDPSSALGRLLGGGTASGSDEARKDGARVAIDQFVSHPLLGDGWVTVFVGHDVYLQIASAIGIFGLGFYLMMLAPILRPLIAVPPPYGLLAAPGLAAVMIGVVDPSLGSRFIWCVAALALCADRLAAQTEEPSNQVSDSAVQGRSLIHP